MTWRKSHLIYKFWISCDDYISTRVWVCFDLVNSVLQLIQMPAIFGRSSSSLLPIDWSKIAVFDCKFMVWCYLVCKFFDSFSLVVCMFFVFIKRSFVPDADFVLAEIFDIALASDQPYKFVSYCWEMYFFGSEEWKSFGEIEFHLISENTSRTSCCYPWFVCRILFVCTIWSIYAVLVDVTEKIEILFIDIIIHWNLLWINICARVVLWCFFPRETSCYNFILLCSRVLR